MADRVWVLWHHIGTVGGFKHSHNTKLVLGIFSDYEYANRALCDCIADERGASTYSVGEWTFDDYDKEEI